MPSVASRELRNHTRRLLDRVEAGEDVTITVDGRPIARLTALTRPRPRWIARDALFDRLGDVQADAQLTTDLATLAPDSTEDLDPL